MAEVNQNEQDHFPGVHGSVVETVIVQATLLEMSGFAGWIQWVGATLAEVHLQGSIS